MNAGLMVLLDMAGNTIAQQAQRIADLEQRVAELEQRVDAPPAPSE